MTNPRRDLLKGGALFAAASLLPKGALSSENVVGTDFDKAHGALQDALADHFTQMGYTPVDASPIITGDESFNGGLRYDETGLIDQPGQMAIQQCTRLEDIGKRHHRDVLPLFHIFRCNKPLGFKSQQTLAQALTYLTETLAIDTGRLCLISTPRLEKYAPVLKRAQIDVARQVLLRDDAEALAAADGSGYFRFPGDENADTFATVGIYCWIGEGIPMRPESYPPSQVWTEIGEASLDEGESMGFALGTERVTLATTGLMPSWQERLVQLFEIIESDSGGGALPSGREQFAKQ